MPTATPSLLGTVRAVAWIFAVAAASILPTIVIPEPVGGWVGFAASLALVFWVSSRSGSPLGRLGLEAPESWLRTVASGALYAVILFLAFKVFLEPGAEAVTGTARDLSRFRPLEGDLLLLGRTVLLFWITAGFYEEVVFRGFIIRELAEPLGGSAGAWAAGAVFSSLLFAMSHSYQGPAGLAITLLGAFALAGIYLAHRKNLWIVVVAHGLFDTGTAALFYFGWYDGLTSLLF